MIEMNELKKFDLFCIYTDAQLKKLQPLVERVSFKARASVYEQGERAKNLYVVVSGLVSLREMRTGDPVGIAYEMRERGDMFGPACFMRPQQYSLTAVCLEDSDLLSVDAEKLFALCESDMEMGYKLMKKIAQIYFDRYQVAKKQVRDMVKAPEIIMALPG